MLRKLYRFLVAVVSPLLVVSVSAMLVWNQLCPGIFGPKLISQAGPWVCSSS